MPTRRAFFASLGAVTAISSSGCVSDGTSTAIDPDSTAAPSPQTATRAPTRFPDARSVLPKSTDEWELERTERMEASVLGGDSGEMGYYDSPEGARYKAVALELSDDYAVTAKAERWTCIGWDVALTYDGFVFAAGSGTDQQTFTPETPPHMTRTPVPGTEDESRELLSHSPLLTTTIIRENEATCDS